MGAERRVIARAKNASAPHHGPSRLAPSGRRSGAFDFCRDQPGQLMITIPIVLRKVNPMPIAEWVAESGVDLRSHHVDV